MSAYIIVDTKITDPEAYEEYKALARPIAEKYGAIYRARGGKMKVLEEELWSPSRIVVLEFPTMEAAETFANSPEYAPVKAIRNANADCTLVIVEGI
ncbi:MULTISPECIES: DUF1330 domain-containing protein [Pseudovibrio]|uniref:DUF1330 domain-containing protein n=1 Tax=Stappiaceae TaxID=2821832 RepID=UPI002366746E|nr:MULTISPECIES: DUF1330 domain-containing protein [Pseudovibrio]MDD7911199.1 DUF1330 domain-containing protein [Pseudovibrio exalbescens]MDX5593114.1 DUF1330 domain-containing protein [Pseudovibrio sp. SPO723]